LKDLTNRTIQNSNSERSEKVLVTECFSTCSIRIQIEKNYWDLETCRKFRNNFFSVFCKCGWSFNKKSSFGYFFYFLINYVNLAKLFFSAQNLLLKTLIPCIEMENSFDFHFCVSFFKKCCNIQKTPHVRSIPTLASDARIFQIYLYTKTILITAVHHCIVLNHAD